MNNQITVTNQVLVEKTPLDFKGAEQSIGPVLRTSSLPEN